MWDPGEPRPNPSSSSSRKVPACKAPRKSPQEVGVPSITVTSTPVRANNKPSIMPAGPPPATRHVVLSDCCSTPDLGRIVAHWIRLSGRIGCVGVNGFLNWWDSVELWLSGLPFALQALAVMPVVLGLAYITAAVLDALLGKGIKVMRRIRHSDEAPE